MKAGQKVALAPEKKPRRRIKKVKVHGDHHGGSWKVAYADFVTAMMALFLVLWLVSQADIKLKEAIANYFRSPGVFSSVRGGIISRSSTMSKDPSPQDDEESLMTAAVTLRQKFRNGQQFEKVKDRIKIEITDEGLRIQILDKAQQVSFASGSAELTPEAREILSEVAVAICALPNPIYLGGHTDRRNFPGNSAYTNWELSADRANAARRHLEASCVKPEQIRRVIGYADTELLVPNDPYAPANRRISIIVSRLRAKIKSDDKPEAKPEPESPAKPATTNPAARTGDSDEKRLSETKLRNEGAVSVGGPDQLPAGVRRSRAR